MKFLVFGSLNIDKVYSLDYLPEKGETLSCKKYEIHVGGKGLNQSVSLAKSGGEVYMAGCIGQDGIFLKEFLEHSGVNTSMLKISDSFTGHAVIEVDSDGQNQMILFPGANYEITEDYCNKVLKSFGDGDVILLQYETAQVEYMIEKAHANGIKIAFNPSPFVKKLCDFDYSKIDYLILNESEGQCITGKSDTDEVIDGLLDKLDGGSVILTLGADGAIFADGKIKVKAPAFKVNAVDTTGAGDTFTGYCLTSICNGEAPEKALKTASAASALVVKQSGAAETIPEKKQVLEFMNN